MYVTSSAVQFISSCYIFIGSPSPYLYSMKHNIIITVYHSSGILSLFQISYIKMEIHSVSYYPTYLKSLLEFHLVLGIKAMLCAESTFFSDFCFYIFNFKIYKIYERETIFILSELPTFGLTKDTVY